MAKANEKITRPLIDRILSELRMSDISRVRNYVQAKIKREAGADDSSASFSINLHNVPQDVYDTFSEPELATDDRSIRWKSIGVGATALTLFLHIEPPVATS